MLGMTKARSGASESSLGIYGHVDLHGPPWTSMEFHQAQWRSVEVYTFPVLLKVVVVLALGWGRGGG